MITDAVFVFMTYITCWPIVWKARWVNSLNYSSDWKIKLCSLLTLYSAVSHLNSPLFSRFSRVSITRETHAIRQQTKKLCPKNIRPEREREEIFANNFRSAKGALGWLGGSIQTWARQILQPKSNFRWLSNKFQYRIISSMANFLHALPIFISKVLLVLGVCLLPW